MQAEKRTTVRSRLPRAASLPPKSSSPGRGRACQATNAALTSTRTARLFSQNCDLPTGTVRNKHYFTSLARFLINLFFCLCAAQPIIHCCPVLGLSYISSNPHCIFYAAHLLGHEFNCMNDASALLRNSHRSAAEDKRYLPYVCFNYAHLLPLPPSPFPDSQFTVSPFRPCLKLLLRGIEPTVVHPARLIDLIIRIRRFYNTRP
jgi:hypothetical protein